MKRTVATAVATSLVVTTAMLAVNVPVSQADETITVVNPDLSNPGSVCTSSFDIGPTVLLRFDSTGRPYLDEYGFIYSSSYGSAYCSSSLWVSTVIISDKSPTHPTLAAVNTGSEATVGYAYAHQNVTYGIGLREEGVVTIRFQASSRFAYWCFLYEYHFDVVTQRTTSLLPRATTCVDNDA